jgi:hypothetical protein
VSNYPGDESMSILQNVENTKSNNVIRDIRIGEQIMGSKP